MAENGNRSNIRISLSGDDRGLSAALGRARAGVSAFSRAATSAGSALGRSFGPALGGIASAARSATVAVTGLSAAMATGFAASSISASMQLNRLNVAFSSIFGDQAASEMDFVRKTANKLGLDLQAVASSYQMIAASARGTSMEGQKTRDLFVAVSEAASALHLSSDETQGALLALSQMISKGKVSTEELRQQLGERLPGAFQLAAKAMGMTAMEFDKALASGKVMSDDFLPKFTKALHEAWGGAAVQSAESFQSAVNRVSNSFFEFRASAGEAVTNNTFFAEALKRLPGALNDQGQMTAENAQKWRDWAKTAGLAVLQFGEVAAGGLQVVYRGFYALKAAANATAGALLQVYGAIKSSTATLSETVANQASRMGLGDTEFFRQLREEVAAYREDAEAAKQAAQALYGDAAKDAQKMQEGSQAIAEFGGKIKAFREEMEKVEAKPLEDVKESAKETVEVWKRVNGVWVNVQEEVKKESSDTTKSVQENWQGALDAVEKKTIESAKKMDDALNKATRDRNITITMRQVEKRALGGLIGAARLACGGKLPGFGGGDRIPALLEAGEYVIRKEAVSRFGAGLFDALNRLHLPDLSALLPLPAPVAAAGGGRTVNINLSLGGDTFQMQTDEHTAKKLERWYSLRSSNRVSRTAFKG